MNQPDPRDYYVVTARVPRTLPERYSAPTRFYVSVHHVHGGREDVDVMLASAVGIEQVTRHSDYVEVQEKNGRWRPVKDRAGFGIPPTEWCDRVAALVELVAGRAEATLYLTGTIRVGAALAVESYAEGDLRDPERLRQLPGDLILLQTPGPGVSVGQVVRIMGRRNRADLGEAEKALRLIDACMPTIKERADPHPVGAMLPWYPQRREVAWDAVGTGLAHPPPTR